MPDEARYEAARQWMEKADDALRVAARERELSPAFSVHRAYYACFYAATAVVLMEGKKFVKHAAVRSAVHTYLVREGRLSVELGEAYGELMKARHDADYEVLISWTPQEAAEAVESPERIVAALRALLPSEGRP